jgi:sugar/nucleoside kinase (ribokinase family)
MPRGGDRPGLIVAGNASIDLLLGPVAPWPTVGTEALVDGIAWRLGGALGNTALALHGLGVHAELVWDVGDDEAGQGLAALLKASFEPPRVQRAPTSVTVALTHPSGERTFVSHLGHLAVSEPDALAVAIEAAAPGDLLLVGGTFLLPRWRPALPALFARARERGVVTALDTGWPSQGWTEAVRSELFATLAHVDLFLPHLDEVRGLLGGDDLAPDAALRALAPRVAGRVVVELGPAGAGYLDGGRFAVAPAPPIEVADTVGAGDTFNAALLAGMRDGLPWDTAVTAAVDVASQAVASSPRRYPAWAEVRAMGPGRAPAATPATH